MNLGNAILSTIFTGLGLVANGPRAIQPGTQYQQYFSGTDVKGAEIELMAEGSVYDTLKHMAKIVRSTRSQTERIAKKLKGKNVEETARNVWNFLYHHVQYKKDNPLREQLRTPARTWKDRKAGVDCDCYSIFISSVLSNLGIPHAFRMAGYDGDFQHVYVVVPKDGKTYGSRSSYLVIDPVVNQFNYETEFSKKHDHTMSRTTMLNGLGACSSGGSGSGPSNPQNNININLVNYVEVDQVEQMGLVPTQKFLEEQNIPYHQTGEHYGEFVVGTPGGEIKLPSIINPEQAQKIKQLMASTGAAAQQTFADLQSKVTVWWFVALGLLALIIFSPNGRARGVSGLGGPPKPKTKKAPARSGRLASMTI